MPRPIHVPPGTPGIATYTLNAHEEWTLLATTFTVDDPTLAGVQSFNVFDCLDPAGGLIYRQALGVVQYKPAQYSLSAHGTPWTVNFNLGEEFPGPLKSVTYPVVSASLPVLTLGPACTVRAYACLFTQPPNVDLAADLDATSIISDLHLWIEDTGRSFAEQVPVGPYMLVPGPNA